MKVTAKGVVMILKRIETFATADVSFVRVTAEDGAQGWGQVSTYHGDITCQILHRQVARGCWAPIQPTLICWIWSPSANTNFPARICGVPWVVLIQRLGPEGQDRWAACGHFAGGSQRDELMPVR